ncbi:MAG: O-antigen ligase family protein [Opitutus sp.]|nr:O-antigen ligase family protein [Opitutus sp.]MCS6274407.1 O-antigen ligase family protein [Opitutus sp.]MCS6278391.1 O-antigen ligase family protein [Opitutus sp.]MCS6299781.1 O-antigen ligase family protein [Opitutus sp.]
MNLLFGDRFDFLGIGPASSNLSAAILACALVSCAWCFLQTRRRWQWLGLILGLGFSVLLIATKSRGGLIAAGCGMGLVALIHRPRISRSLLIGGAVAILAVAVYGTFRGVWFRFTYGDDSRSDLWRAGLAMLWDAPNGVGTGNASNFFAQWYQEIGDRRGYLSLINYHLNLLAEHGLAARLGYAMSWAGLAWFVWPRRTTPLLTTAAAVWLSFFVAAIFSNTAKAWQVWALPLVWLVLVAAWRIRHRSFAPARTAYLSAGVALLSLLSLHAIGWWLSSPQLSTGSDSIRCGDQPPRVILYAPNPGVLGEKWGQDLRASAVSALVLRSSATLPADLPRDTLWIISGDLPPNLPPKSRVHLFNLPATPETLAWIDRQAPASVRVTLSDSLCRELRCDDWFNWSDRHPETTRIKLMGGVNLFIPSWSWFDEE